MAGRRRSCFVPLAGPLRLSPEYTSADHILPLREDGAVSHRLATSRPNRPRAQRFTATNHIGPLLSGSDSNQARGYNRSSPDMYFRDNINRASSDYLRHLASSGPTSGRTSPASTSDRTSPAQSLATDWTSPGYISDRTSPGHTSGRTSPRQNVSTDWTSPGYISVTTSQGYTSGRTSPEYTSHRSAQGYGSCRALSGYTSGRTSPGYRSDRSSIRSAECSQLSSQLSINSQSAESVSQQLDRNCEWSFTDIDFHAIVDRDYRFVTITPSTSEDGINSDLPTCRRRQSWSEDEKQYLIQAMTIALTMKAMEDAGEEIVAMARMCPYSMGADVSSSKLLEHQARNNKRFKLFEKFQNKYPKATCLRDQLDNKSSPCHLNKHQSESCRGPPRADDNACLSLAHNAALVSEECDTAVTVPIPETETTHGQIHQVDPYSPDMHTTWSNDRRCADQVGPNDDGCTDEVNKEYRRRKLRYVSDPSMSSSSELSDSFRQKAEHGGHRKHSYTRSRSWRFVSNSKGAQSSKKRSSGSVTVDFSCEYMRAKANLALDNNLGQVLGHSIGSRQLSSSDYTNQRYNYQADRTSYGRVIDHALADNDSSRPHDPGIFRGHSIHRVTDYFDCRPPRCMQGRLPSSFCSHGSREQDRRFDEVYRHNGLADRRSSERRHTSQRIRKYHEKGSLVLDFSPPKRT